MKTKRVAKSSGKKSKLAEANRARIGAWRVNETHVSYIYNQIFNNKYPTVEVLADALRVTPLTIKRIIRHMKLNRDLPIKTSRTRGKEGYYLVGSFSSTIARTITDQELMNYFMGKRAIEQFPGKGGKKFTIGFGKLSQLIDARTIKLLDEIQDAVYFHPFAPEKIDVDLFFGLMDAVVGKRVVLYDYTKFRAKVAERKRVWPFCFTCRGGAWYMIAYDEKDGKVKTFMLSRLAKPEITKDRFKKPKDWSIEKHFEGAFIALAGNESHDVVVEFDDWAAAFIRNRDFTPDQKFEELPDGGLRMSMHLTALEEVEAWICYWRQHATVIGPAALRDRMAIVGDDYRNKYGGEINREV